MKNTSLGNKEISVLGFGCFQLTEPVSSKPSLENAIQLVKFALENGINFFDTADIYGVGESEIRLGQALELHKLSNAEREKLVIATKIGLIRKVNQLESNGSCNYLLQACDASLNRLGTTYIDILYLHRVDPHTPIEFSMKAMRKLLDSGKVRHIGLSEVDIDTINTAQACGVPISFVQNEFSLAVRSRDEEKVIAYCKAHNIKYVPYCPIARGFLSDKLDNNQTFSSDDFRSHIPFLRKENLLVNIKKRADLQRIAAQANCSITQLCLAWLLRLGDHIIPIPGTKSLKYLEENIKSAAVELTDEIMKEIDQLYPPGCFSGEHLPSRVELEKALRSPIMNTCNNTAAGDISNKEKEEGSTSAAALLLQLKRITRTPSFRFFRPNAGQDDVGDQAVELDDLLPGGDTLSTEPHALYKKHRP